MMRLTLISCLILVLVYSIDAKHLNRSKKVKGGEDAGNDEFPYFVLFIEDGHSFCGGTLIDTQWVLTAAHCLDATITGASVVAGVTSMSDRSNMQTRKVIGYVAHETFVKNSKIKISANDKNKMRVFVDDIGLVYLDKPFDISRSHVKTIKMSTSSNYPTGDVFVAGWGLISQNPPEVPKQLKKAKLTIKDYKKCTSHHHNIGGIPPLSFCADVPDKDIGVCDGDSGGPAVQGSGNRRELIGVINFGGSFTTCGVVNRPSVLLRVSEYQDWITDNKAAILKQVKSKKGKKRSKKLFGSSKSQSSNAEFSQFLLNTRDKLYQSYLDSMDKNWILYTKPPMNPIPQ